ncbi:MAG: leucine-rich repeat domain-containing protein [Muribaculaceae bacterium]|nr:leucine-rich repeat domain-containing protein [Muribaculaceae bacterium]
MNNSYLSLLVALAALGSQSQADARNVLLPFGNFSHEPWDANYLFLDREVMKDHSDFTTAPGEDWFLREFDDTSWKKIEGPVSTETGAPSYYNSIWEGEYGASYIRRHFTVSDPLAFQEVILYTIHDDDMVVYLNGEKIYSNGSVINENSTSMTTILNEDVKSIIVEGDNVIAVSVYDRGGSVAFADFGIYGYNLKNGAFEYSGVWKGSFDRSSYSGNTFAYGYGMNFVCQQELENMPMGLYRLSANACGVEYYNDFNQAWAHREDEVPSHLFIGSHEAAIPSAFSEPSIDRGDYKWEVGGQYVPNTPQGASKVLNQNTYFCDVWGVYDPTVDGETLTLGVKSVAASDIKRWAVWDNLDLEYFSEKQVDALLKDIVDKLPELEKSHLDADLLNNVKYLISQIDVDKDFLTKANLFSEIIKLDRPIRKSIDAYARLAYANSKLKEAIDAANDRTSPATVAKANILCDAISDAYESGNYVIDIIDARIAEINYMIRCLGYTYVDIVVDVPGAMGDSILKKVENFVDVESIRISGTLNSEDIANIKTRLTSLREIDLTEVDMKELPAEFFYRRSSLESIILPRSVASIGDRAMYQCYGLINIAFPSTLQSIGGQAFYECRSLVDIQLPEGLSSLGTYAFYNCTSLKHVELPSTLKTISEYAFYNNSNLKSLDFKDGLTHINNSAFSNCQSIESLNFPSTLYYIGKDAFLYNRSLHSIDFNEGLFQIADNAFYDCDALTEVTLPSTLVLANESPFDYCDNLVKVTCLSIEPPYMTDQIPYGLGMDGRELYVPELSLNLYKQTAGWDRFPTIKPIDYLPENITVLGNVRLTLPENIPADYKPNVNLIHDSKGGYYSNYGSLTVNGAGTLSIADFSMGWDPSDQYSYGDNIYNGAMLQHFNSLLNNSHLRADNVAIEMFPHNDRWSFITFPFDVNISDIESIRTGSTSFAIRKYDGAKRAAGETAETWVKVKDDETLNAGEGYIIQTSRYIGNSSQNWSGLKFKAVNNGNKNNIFISEDAEVMLKEYVAEFAHNRSWNLIGNPYACYYDTRFMDFSAPLTVWNMGNNTYSAVSPIDDSYILCPGEAFFVQSPVDDPKITFRKEGRQTNRVARTIENAPRKVRDAGGFDNTRVKFNFLITDGKFTDRTRIVLNERAALDYEQDKDAGKFRSSDNTIPQIFTYAAGIEYAINERPIDNAAVVLGIHAGIDGLYSIALSEDVEDYKVVLEDTFTSEKIYLSEDKPYSFNSEKGDFNDRFYIRFVSGNSSVDAIKMMEHEKDDIFSIDGVKVADPLKGEIYIINGKKVIFNN